MEMAEHVCPIWVGHLLASPLRKLFQNPSKILGAYVSRGKHVLDVGSAMGFFSLYMASVVSPDGKVYSIDLQQEMLDKLMEKAKAKNLDSSIEPINCSTNSLCIEDLEGKIDFALIFAVLHEVTDQERFLGEVFNALRPGGTCLLSEPKGHVNQKAFELSLELAEKVGFKLEHCPSIPRGLSVIMSKKRY